MGYQELQTTLDSLTMQQNILETAIKDTGEKRSKESLEQTLHAVISEKNVVQGILEKKKVQKRYEDDILFAFKVKKRLIIAN